MKYLRGYKLFESLSTDEKEDIKDILLELEDDGFSIEFDTREVGYLSYPHNYYYVTIERKIEFKYSDVSEVIERLKDYLGDKIEEIVVKVPKVIIDHIYIVYTWVDLLDYISDKDHLLYKDTISILTIKITM